MSSSWDAYITDLMTVQGGHDAAIFGLNPVKLWAAYEGGEFKNIQECQIKALLSSDTDKLCTHGLTLGSKRCAMIRNEISLNGCADLKVKSEKEDEKRAVAVAMSKTALILLEGSHVQGSNGKVNMKASSVAGYLKDCGV